MTVEPLNTFPKEFHACRKTHVAFVASGTCHAHMNTHEGSQNMVSSVWQIFPERIRCNFITDSTDYLKVDHGEGWNIIIPLNIR